MCPTRLFLPPAAAAVGMEADGIDAAAELGSASLSPLMLFLLLAATFLLARGGAGAHCPWMLRHLALSPRALPPTHSRHPPRSRRSRSLLAMDASGGARWRSASDAGWLDSAHPSPHPELTRDAPSPRARPRPSPVELPLLCSTTPARSSSTHLDVGSAAAPKKRWGPARPGRKKRWGSAAAPKKNWAWRLGATAPVQAAGDGRRA
jgi:hypothetical protein